MPGRWVAAAARPAVTQPLRCPVPADDAAHWQRKGPLKLAFRTLRRSLAFAASGQSGRLRSTIDPAWRSCLWIQADAPQVGDALMDLAPRTLLAGRGIAVDLLAPQHLVALFEGDPWLRRCRPSQADDRFEGYDFAVVHGLAGEALRTKRRVAPGLPFVALAGHYSVPDFHRALFATRRLADALGTPLAPGPAQWHSRQKLAPMRTVDRRLPVDPGPRVGLALGGVRVDRTYRHWPEVVRRLQAAGLRSFVLAGSANGLAARAQVAAAAGPGVVLHDLVDRTDLLGTRTALGACDLVVCADGGLMHLALTTPTPVLPLFTRSIDPAWRLPIDSVGEVLLSASGEVSGIEPADVAAAALRCLGHGRGATAERPFNAPG